MPETNLYYELAQEIIAQGRIFYDTSHPYYDVVGPVLPWINAVTMLIFGKNYLGLYLVTSLASALITYFTYKTSRLLLDKRTSLFAGLWSMFYLFYFYFSPNPGKDIWMAMFMIVLIYLILKLFICEEFSYSRFILFIVLYVISFHLDERFFMFTPFIFIYILFKETDSFRKLRITKTLLFAGLLIILMIPWTVRNYIKHDKIVLISTRTQILTDKILGYGESEFEFDDFMDLKGVYYIQEHQIDSVIKGYITVTDGGYEISEKQRRAMKQGRLPHQLSPIEAVWVRTKDILRPFQLRGEYQKTGYFYYQKSLIQNIASFLFYGIMFFFSFPGFYFLFRKNRHIFYLFLSIILIYTIIHTFFVPWTTWRYRLPLDAIFIIVGCLGLTKTFKIFKNKVIYNK